MYINAKGTKSGSPQLTHAPLKRPKPSCLHAERGFAYCALLSAGEERYRSWRLVWRLGLEKEDM